MTRPESEPLPKPSENHNGMAADSKGSESVAGRFSHLSEEMLKSVFISTNDFMVSK